jgi:hypothetical protein
VSRWALPAAGAVILGIGVVLSPVYALSAAALLVGLPLALRQPFWVGVGLLTWGIVRYSVTPYVGANALAVVELSLAAVVIISAGVKGRRDHWLLGLRAPWILLALFVIASIISWVVNHRPAVELAAGLRGMLILPLIAVSTTLLMDDPDRQMPAVWRIAVAAALIQIPIVFVQYFFGGGFSVDPDLVVGTLGAGGANVMGVLMLATMMQAMAAFFRTNRMSALIGAVLAVVVIIMSSARLELLLAPVCAAAILMTTRASGGVGRRVVLAVLAFAVAAPILFFASSGYRTELGGSLNVRQLVNEQTVLEPGRVPRLAYIAYGWSFIQGNSAFVPLGTGPGSAASGAAAGLRTGEAVDFATGLRLVAAGTSSDARQIENVSIPYPTQFVATMVEEGVTGLFLYFGFVVTLGLAILRRCSREQHASADPRVFFLWFVFMTIGTLYANPWEGFSLLGIGFFATLLFLRPSGIHPVVPTKDAA